MSAIFLKAEEAKEAKKTSSGCFCRWWRRCGKVQPQLRQEVEDLSVSGAPTLNQVPGLSCVSRWGLDLVLLAVQHSLNVL